MTANNHGNTPHSAPVDGEAHIAYYDRSAQLSFVWTGKFGDVIHVQRGGYGEPTIATINPVSLYVPWNLEPHEIMTWFQIVCATWVEVWEN